MESAAEVEYMPGRLPKMNSFFAALLFGGAIPYNEVISVFFVERWDPFSRLRVQGFTALPFTCVLARHQDGIGSHGSLFPSRCL